MEEEIAEWKKLLETTYKLFGPEGCPWDREQTLVSMRGSLLEEAYEVHDALDECDDTHLAEELGDLLYNIIFLCQLGEKEERFSLKLVLAKIREKLITRHPHVFGEKIIKETSEVVEQWDKIKFQNRESLMDGIPKALPALALAYKIAGKLKKAKYPHEHNAKPSVDFNDEKDLGELLWAIVLEAKERGLHPEHALRNIAFHHEKEFREWEKK